LSSGFAAGNAGRRTVVGVAATCSDKASAKKREAYGHGREPRH
jgi:hypothetical protein